MKSYANTLLSNDARIAYKSVIERMWALCPSMMARKIPEANVQQAFVFDMVSSLSTKEDSILCVGSFEDTAYESLVKSGYNLVGIDPLDGGLTLDSYFNQSNGVKHRVIFSTSVIEHVENDSLFLEQICKLLDSNGIAVLTTDFNNEYYHGMALPYTDVRFYTKHDLETRICDILKANGCSLTTEPLWEGENDFWYQGHTYSFATIVFIKNKNV